MAVMNLKLDGQMVVFFLVTYFKLEMSTLYTFVK